MIVDPKSNKKIHFKPQYATFSFFKTCKSKLYFRDKWTIFKNHLSATELNVPIKLINQTQCITCFLKSFTHLHGQIVA